MKNLLIIIVLCLLSIKVSAQVSVIVNKSVPESSINAAKLSNIYSLNVTKWENGVKIVVVDQNDKSDSKPKFYHYISKDPIAVQKDWLRKVITGEAKAPEALGSDADVIKKVASTPGAIGYVKSSSVTGDVKVIAEIK